MKHVAIALLLTGCATTQIVWNKPGSSQQEFLQDRGQCQAQAFSVPNAPAAQIAIVFSGCMQGKGWTAQEVPAR